MARESGGIYGTSGTIASSRSRLNKFNISDKKAVICDTLSMPLGTDLSGNFDPTTSLPIRYDAVNTSGTSVSPNGGYTLIANSFMENTDSTSASGKESTNSAQLTGTASSITAKADTFIENVNTYVIAATGHARIIGYTGAIKTPDSTQTYAATGPAYFVGSNTAWPSTSDTTTMYVTCDFGYKPSLTSYSGFSYTGTAYASNQYKTTLGTLTSDSEEVTTGVKVLKAISTGYVAPVPTGFVTAYYQDTDYSTTYWYIKLQVHNPNDEDLYCHYFAYSSADGSSSLTHMVTEIAAWETTSLEGWLDVGAASGVLSTDWDDITDVSFIPPLFFSNVGSTYRSAIYDTSPVTLIVLNDYCDSGLIYRNYGGMLIRVSEAYDVGRETNLYTDQQYSSSDGWNVID